jgi:hypothetical protein
MVATATRAAGTAALQVFRGGHAAEFKSLADHRHDPFLHLVHGLLRIDKTLGNRVAKKSLAFGVEVGDFRFVQLEALLLLVVQKAAFFGQAFILLLRFGIGHEGIHLLADALEFGLLHDAFAKLAGFLADQIVGLNKCIHNIVSFTAPAGRYP